jgi:hypothetical protein
MSIEASILPVPTQSSRTWTLLRSWKFVTLWAIEYGGQVALPTVFGRHPAPNLPGRIMAHVLLVAARELRYPVALLVLMETSNRLLHKR